MFSATIQGHGFVIQNQTFGQPNDLKFPAEPGQPVANAVVTLTPAHGMDTRLTPAQRRGAAAAKPVLRTDQQGNLTPRVLIVRPGQEIGLEHEQDPAPMVRSRPYDQPFFLA
jgi:hypothetical protein